MIKEEIVGWVEQQPYWLQVVSDLIFKGEKLDDEVLDRIYELFKQELGLTKEPLKKDDIQFSSGSNTQSNYAKMKWKLISDVQGVNALKEGQSLEIGKQLTVIYGDNGSGKSGYTRIFNNAFLSRGDKKILPNVFKNDKVSPSALFEFMDSDGKTSNISYPKDENNYLFSTISVFDTVSAMHDLTKEDELSFSPVEFKFFDKLMEAFVTIKDKLNAEISERNQTNNFEDYFDKDTSVKLAVKKLNGQSKYNEIKSISDVSASDEVFKEKLKRKKYLESLNIDEKLKEFSSVKQDLEVLKENVQKLNSRFSAERIRKTHELLIERTSLKELSAQEGLPQFEDEHIYKLGSSEWKNFILAADAYYKSIDNKVDDCIFCGQSIEKITVIDKYWNYLKSSAEKNLSTAELNIKKLKINFKDQNLTLVVKKSRLEEWLKKNKLDLYEEILTAEREFSAIRSSIIENLASLEWNSSVESYNVNISHFDDVFKMLEKNIEELDASKVTAELNEIDIYINEYGDKLKLEKLLPRIKEYISCMNWVDLAKKINLSTQKITTFQNKLFSKYVSEKYIERFHSECRRLEANFSAEIKQRGRKGSTVSKLTISGGSPTDILSEGEQRSIALANFLAETSLDDNNECLVFDDPVSSLDHKRRDSIAKRLVEEAGEKQVVILTHDITFLITIQKYCEDNINCQVDSIINWKGESGIVQDSPWMTLPVRSRIKRLRNDLQSIKSFYDNDITDIPNGIEKYKERAKGWCGLLRETWEKSVEEILFNNAVQRLNPTIQTQRLKNAPYTKTLYMEIEAGMANCSSWVHDRASTMGERVPTPDELDSYLKDCDGFISKNRVK